jgi:hypothetical protein
MKKIYPFKFLDAYTIADKDIFFGRENEINILYEMVFQTDLILVYGASGTGKSSLIQCGLANKFQAYDWLPLHIRRGTNLNASLDKALEDAGGKNMVEENDMDWFEEDLDKTPLTPLAKKFKAVYLASFRPIYLIFDQFEELYILGNKAEQNQFIETIKEILLIEQPIKIIFSIREEYLGYLYEFEKKVPELLRKKIRIEPMNFDKVKDVILGIAKLKNSLVKIAENQEEAITEQVFTKIKGKENRLTIELPYLQVFLDKYYLSISHDTERKSEATFTLEALEKIGNMDNILNNFLNDQTQEVAKELGFQDDRNVWEILSPFVTLEGTKEPLSLEELHKRVENIAPNILQQVINSFVKRRILRQLDNENLYEIAHDTLAKQIASKRSDEEIALLEIEKLIKHQLAFGKDLFTEKQMNVISPYQNQLNKKLNQEELQLLTDSQKAIEQAKIAKRNRTLAIWITTILFIVVVSVFGIFAYWQWQKAESAKKEAQDQANKAQIALDDFLERQIGSITKKSQEDKKAEKALDDLKRQIDNITKKSQEDKALDDLKRQIGELQERRKQAEEQKELEKELNDLMDIFARIDRFPRSELEKAIKELNNLLKIRFSRNQHKKAIKELNNLLQSHIFLISELEEAIKELNNLLQSDRFSRSEHKKAIKELNNLLRSYIVLIIELKEAIKELNYLLQSDRFPRSELEKAIKELNNLLQSDRFPNSRAAIQQKINELRNKK